MRQGFEVDELCQDDATAQQAAQESLGENMMRLDAGLQNSK